MRGEARYLDYGVVGVYRIRGRIKWGMRCYACGVQRVWKQVLQGGVYPAASGDGLFG